MGKKLAIQGHPTRGKEVIELLEMMGGINKNMLSAHIGDVLNPHVYFLEPDSSDNRIVWNYLLGLEWDGRASDMMIFTLEEFLEKFPYKLNELVLCDDGLLGVITKMEWDCEKSNMKYYISFKISDYNKWYSSKNIICNFMEAKGKKLAIKGHPTRGKEVIELLEMLGGINDEGYIGTNTWKDEYYFLDNGYIRAYDWCDGIKFTLEEFLEKYPYKIGDKVYTKSNAEGTIIDMFWDGIEVLYQLSSESVNALGYFHRNELNLYREELNMEDNKLFGTLSNPVETKSYAVSLKDGKVIDNSIDSVQFIQSGKIVAVRFNTQNYENEVELQLDDYEIVVRDGKTYAVKNKPKYPTTYEECYDEGNTELHFIYVDKDERDLYESFIQLIRCRNAYWKIAGEHMGLDKPWEPDWDNLSTNHEFIKINKGCFTYSSRLLVFPIEEMRDAFYENFKDLIEQCKELL